MHPPSSVPRELGAPERPWDVYDLEMLDRIQKRVLWLSTYIVHYANFLRPNADGR